MRPLAVIGLLAVASLVSPTAGAQPVRACPPGQAVQALDPGGKVATCIPVPSVTDLNGRIDAEAVARMAADDALRGELTENGLTGRYAFVGTGLCLRVTSNTVGFSTSPEFAPLPGSTEQSQSFTYSGVKEFDGLGNIQGTSTVFNISYPAIAPGVGLVNTGGGTVLSFTQNWTYTVGADRSIRITGAGSQGTITHGTGGIGNHVTTHGAPSLAGRVSKDWRTIIVTNESMAVEHSVTTTPDDQQVLADFPRICTRTETLTKLAD